MANDKAGSGQERQDEAGRAGGGTSRPGMMGDGTEEQNLNQPGNPDARITEKEVEEAFRRGEGGNKADRSS